jgi:hypothetical protein
MDSDLFLARFRQALMVARDFARQFVEEPLPDEVRCRLQLNSSYDGNPLHEDETVFPDDSAPERDSELASILVEEAAAVLWRGDKVPEWVNVSVVGKTEQCTVIEVDSCGRFTANDDLLYHAREGRPPFHVLGPALPLNHVDGVRFSVFYRASCRTAAELESVRAHRARPWSLKLAGPVFHDDVLSAIGSFPALEILELKECPLDGPGLAACSQMPQLRMLRMNRHPVGKVSLSALPHLPAFQYLQVNGLSAPPDLAILASATPGLVELSLGFTSTERTLEIPRLDALNKILITADHLSHGVQVSGASKVHDISIHGRLSDREVLGILEQLPAINSVNLDSTEVTDETVAFLSRQAQLSYVCLQRTKASDAAVQALRAAHPNARVHF